VTCDPTWAIDSSSVAWTHLPNRKWIADVSYVFAEVLPNVAAVRSVLMVAGWSMIAAITDQLVTDVW
jgi:hypothetical protein